MLESLESQFNILHKISTDIEKTGITEPEQYEFLIKSSLAMVEIANLIIAQHQSNQGF